MAKRSPNGRRPRGHFGTLVTPRATSVEPLQAAQIGCIGDTLNFCKIALVELEAQHAPRCKGPLLDPLVRSWRNTIVQRHADTFAASVDQVREDVEPSVLRVIKLHSSFNRFDATLVRVREFAHDEVVDPQRTILIDNDSRPMPLRDFAPPCYPQGRLHDALGLRIAGGIEDDSIQGQSVGVQLHHCSPQQPSEGALGSQQLFSSKGGISFSPNLDVLHQVELSCALLGKRQGDATIVQLGDVLMKLLQGALL
mmetsp:Transcript_57084/g.184846  ORF Transcript_57084/g.184846 Transcript_57084/m.184846 type:complete len:253 (+) Transcript_57084:546-1304(+)